MIKIVNRHSFKDTKLGVPELFHFRGMYEGTSRVAGPSLLVFRPERNFVVDLFHGRNRKEAQRQRGLASEVMEIVTIGPRGVLLISIHVYPRSPRSK